MTFDNGKTIIALRLRVFIATVLLIIYVYFAFLGKELKFPVAGISVSGWTSILLSLYFIISFYPLFFKYRYIYFSDDGPEIIIRYYSVGLVQGPKRSIEIPKSDFEGFTVSPFLGVFRMLTLRRRIDRRIASYPPVHLGALSRKEIARITDALDSIKSSGK